MNVKWRTLFEEELYILCYSPGVIRQIKLTRLGWGGHSEFMGERETVNMFR